MQNTNLHELEQKIGYQFKNIEHLKIYDKSTVIL